MIGRLKADMSPGLAKPSNDTKGAACAAYLTPFSIWVITGEFLAGCMGEYG